MKFFRNYNMISVPGWHMTAVTVNKETLTEAMGTGVYFLDGKCYFEPTDMTAALRTIWQENAAEQEAICFTALNGQLQGKRILNVLGLLGHIRLFLNLSSTHAEGTERPDGFMVLASAVLKRNEIPFEAYDKADWDEKTCFFQAHLKPLNLCPATKTSAGLSIGRIGMEPV